MITEIAIDQDYRIWLGELKSKFRQAQITAAIKVNSTQLAFYWELGADIVAKQQHSVWGEGFLSRLSQDLMAEFPEVKGFSVRNLKYIRQWHSFYHHPQAIGQQAVAQLCQIPWGHNIVIISKAQTQQEALYYVANTLKHGWSRSVLTHQIESRLWQREGKATHNFAQTLPAMQTSCVYGTQRVRHGIPTQRVGTRRSALVPKLRLGNPDSEAPASRDGKLELPALNSQAGAWELAQTRKLGGVSL